jgi:hypothetical protein
MEEYKLEHLMKLLHLRKISCFVRCDAERDNNIFTVQIGHYPRTDTDDPVRYIKEKLGLDKLEI